MKEAKTLIARKQVWVLETFHARGSSIACIAAITRTAASVTAVTKVYTPPEWRQNGFARRLVREVCRQSVLRLSCFERFADIQRPAYLKIRNSRM